MRPTAAPTTGSAAPNPPPIWAAVVGSSPRAKASAAEMPAPDAPPATILCAIGPVPPSARAPRAVAPSGAKAAAPPPICSAVEAIGCSRSACRIVGLPLRQNFLVTLPPGRLVGAAANRRPDRRFRLRDVGAEHGNAAQRHAGGHVFRRARWLEISPFVNRPR